MVGELIYFTLLNCSLTVLYNEYSGVPETLSSDTPDFLPPEEDLMKSTNAFKVFSTVSVEVQHSRYCRGLELHQQVLVCFSSLAFTMKWIIL